MTRLKIAYFGTPDFSADFLEKLIVDQSINRLIKVELVVTQPDRPFGRKQTIMPTPVKLIAKKHCLECLEIENCKFNESRLWREKIENLDFCLLYAYGKKIPKELLDKPRLGFINIHPSLLPKYRGPSPIAYPLINGDQKTGVTLIKMDDQIDHGPIIAQEELEILPTDKRPDLEKKLTKLAFNMFRKFVAGVVEEGLPTTRRSWGYPSASRASAGGNPRQAPRLISQNHSQATYTKLLKKEDGFIEFKNFKFQISNSPEKLFNLFRGLYLWPGLWTTVKINGVDKRLKITDLDLISNKIVIKKVQLESKKEVDFTIFQKAYKVF